MAPNGRILMPLNFKLSSTARLWLLMSCAGFATNVHDGQGNRKDGRDRTHRRRRHRPLHTAVTPGACECAFSWWCSHRTSRERQGGASVGRGLEGNIKAVQIPWIWLQAFLFWYMKDLLSCFRWKQTSILHMSFVIRFTKVGTSVFGKDADHIWLPKQVPDVSKFRGFVI